jgi:hypothetical protein
MRSNRKLFRLNSQKVSYKVIFFYLCLIVVSVMVIGLNAVSPGVIVQNSCQEIVIYEMSATT